MDKVISLKQGGDGPTNRIKQPALPPEPQQCLKEPGAILVTLRIKW